MSKNQYVEGSCYLLIRGGQDRLGFTHLSGFKAYHRKPNVESDEVAIQLKIKLPSALFEKPLLAASINVDGDVPVMEIEPETVHTIENLIRSQTGLDVQLSVVEPD